MHVNRSLATFCAGGNRAFRRKEASCTRRLPKCSELRRGGLSSKEKRSAIASRPASNVPKLALHAQMHAWGRRTSRCWRSASGETLIVQMFAATRAGCSRVNSTRISNCSRARCSSANLRAASAPRSATAMLASMSTAGFARSHVEGASKPVSSSSPLSDLKLGANERNAGRQHGPGLGAVPVFLIGPGTRRGCPVLRGARSRSIRPQFVHVAPRDFGPPPRQAGRNRRQPARLPFMRPQLVQTSREACPNRPRCRRCDASRRDGLRSGRGADVPARRASHLSRRQ